MGSKLQDSHRHIGNSLDCVLYYNVGNEVSCQHDDLKPMEEIVDDTRDPGGLASRWDLLVGDDHGSSFVYLVASYSQLDLVIYNLYVEVSRDRMVVPYGTFGASANYYDRYDLPSSASC